MFGDLVRRFLPVGGAKITLQAGDSAPVWNCFDHQGEERSSEELRGKRYILWFYPRAATPG
ncbi:MAG: hypothetical protein ABGY71_14155 [bacterium]|jgi:peroxiredoxin Q/BCP|nr:hypothetical protein [Planctomycetota bacterium]HIL50705.1 hypothetical protein [Planctomycetota bacterium]